MVTAITPQAVVFANTYLFNNPEATQQDFQVALRNHLQNLKNQGAKISKKQIAEINANIGEIYKATLQQIRANMMPNVTSAAETAIEALDSAQASVVYSKYGNHSNAEPAQAVTANPKCGNHSNVSKHPELDEQVQSSVVSSNNQNKKAARKSDDAYISSKKRKKMKKQSETASQQAHRQRAMETNPKDKRIRKMRANAAYCTSQGFMTRDAKNMFNNINNTLDGKLNIVISDAPNSTLQAMNEFYSSQEAAAVSKKVPEAAKNVKPSKLTGKAGWIAAGIAGLVGALGLVMSRDSSKNDNSNC